MKQTAFRIDLEAKKKVEAKIISIIQLNSKMKLNKK